jgi:hypothetical protein
MSRIDTYDVVSPTNEKNVVWCYMCNSLGGTVFVIRHGQITDFQGHGLNFEFEIFHSITVKQVSNELWKKYEFTLTLKWRDSFVTNGCQCVTRLTARQQGRDLETFLDVTYLGFKKTSKKVPSPLEDPVPSEVVLDVLDLDKKVSPNHSLLLTTMSF